MPHIFTAHSSFIHQHSEVRESWTLRKNEETRLDATEIKWLGKIAGFVDSKKTNEWVLNKAGVKRELLDTGEKYNARNNARCTQARKTMHSLDGRHQYVDRTIRGKVNQNNRDKWEKVRPWCGQPSDRGRLKNRTEPSSNLYFNGCL